MKSWPQIGWKATCRALSRRKVAIGPEEEGSQQRAFYAALVERAARRKGGGSLTLLLLQPSVSVLPVGPEEGNGEVHAYSLSDFERDGYSKRVRERVAMLEGRGIPLTEQTLLKVCGPHAFMRSMCKVCMCMAAVPSTHLLVCGIPAPSANLTRRWESRKARAS